MQYALPLPFFGILQGLDEIAKRFLNFFAADGDDADDSDKTDDKNEDDEDEGFDTDWESGEEEDDKDGKKKDDGEDDDEDDKSKKKSDDKSGKKKSSIVIQKQKYREKLKDALAEIDRLKNKGDKGDLSAEEKKEKAANEFLAKKIREVLTELKDEEKKAESADEEAFEEELEEVLDENTDITEKQLLEVCEELEVSPKKAIKIIRREAKLKGKEKPKLPNPKRGSGDVDEDDSKDKDGKKKVPSFDEINRRIKEKIKKGLY